MAQHKDKAEEAINELDYSRAINFYTLAIRSDENCSELYSGRARAYYLHLKLNDNKNSKDQWKKIQVDCNKSIQLDKNNYNGLYYLGLYHSDVLSKYDKGLKLLYEAYEKSMNYTKKQKSFIKAEEIYLDIFRVRKLQHELKAEDCIINSNPLFSKIIHLLEKDYHSQIEIINNKNIAKEIKDYKLTSLAIEYNENSKLLISIFGNNYNYAKRPFSEEPPQHFVCPITFQLMHDPVISPSGISYERSVLWDALQRNPSDPLTRKKISQSECYPNTNLKQAIEEYLTINNHNSL